MTRRNRMGFTLMELLVGIALTVLMFLFLIPSFTLLLRMQVKNKAIAEVEQQGYLVMQVIERTIRNAESITSPSAGSSANSLTLDVVAAADDPTVFDVSSGVIRITEGVGSPVDLTSSALTASSVSFTNVSRSSTPGAVRVQFTLERTNSDDGVEYAFEQTFYGTASLRGD